MSIESPRIARVQVTPPLVGVMHPFHPDSQNKIPAFITNGSIGKAPFAVEAGLPLLRSDEVKRATSLAEDDYHRRHGDGVIGPGVVDGRPYPLALAIQKLLAAREILGRDDVLESFFTQDATYGVVIPGTGIDVTIHKPKGPEDLEKLLTFMSEAALSGRAQLTSVAGLARWDEKAETIEAFSARTNLGILKEFDPAILVNRLDQNGHISMGTPTYEVFDYLVDRPAVVQTQIHRYVDGKAKDPQLVCGSLRPAGDSVIETAGESNLGVHLTGLGFFTR